jgi:hypothetical protein
MLEQESTTSEVAKIMLAIEKAHAL